MNTGNTSQWTIATSISLFSLLLLPSYGVFAQDLGLPKYAYQQRGNPDRREGIKPIEISGEKLELVSVSFNPSNLSNPVQSDTYRLGFFLQQQEGQVNVRIRDYDSFGGKYHYWMIPTQRSYPSGFQAFVWNSTIPRELQVRRADLGSVVSLGGYGYPVVAPSALYAEPFLSPVKWDSVRFTFIPNESMTIGYELFPKGQKSRLLLRGSGETWHKDRKNSITWFGLDDREQRAAEGLYILQITARISRPEPAIAYDYEFYYRR